MRGQAVPIVGHGVTTVVSGSFGVGFAPCRAEDRDARFSLMAGVEDIPENRDDRKHCVELGELRQIPRCHLCAAA